MSSSVTPLARPEQHFHGAALIDARGQEIPITEAMIARACETLERHWQYPISHNVPPAR